MRILLLLALTFIFCQCRQKPSYSLDDIGGNWFRTESTDYRSDSMILYIEGDSAKISYLPNGSNFKDDQLKWTDITPISRDASSIRNDFNLLDLSSDGKRYESVIFLKDDTITLINYNYPFALGGIQKWVRN